MRALRSFLVVVLIVVAIVAGAGIAWMRANRGKTGVAAEVKPSFVAVTNAMGVTVLAARAAPGPHVVLFDTGLDPQGHPVDALLRALGATRDDVSDVFLTHAHFDHVAGVPLLPKAKVHLGAADVPLAEGKIAPDALLARFLGFAMSAQPVSVNAPIPSGAATFTVSPAAGNAAAKIVKAIPAPGHTPGSYVFLYDGVLVVGDIMVFKQGRLESPPGVFNPHPDENASSIRALKSALANETIDVVCTAHGGCTPSGLGPNLLNDLIGRLGG
ncbi:MAG TPA: MBL fold metallo-hydrolase [Polyangia bacterium]|nr:MBL fold metallo-hydrolase [Polyangia bacterium]